jgi:hypothetical protein
VSARHRHHDSAAAALHPCAPAPPHLSTATPSVTTSGGGGVSDGALSARRRRTRRCCAPLRREAKATCAREPTLHELRRAQNAARDAGKVVVAVRLCLFFIMAEMVVLAGV